MKIFPHTLKARAPERFWLLVLIIFSALSSLSFADTAQLAVGDKFSVFSDKAYRKNGGRYFEAVGNVVIISGKDTIYGELASLNQDTQMIQMEGNIRIITKDMTLYGSHLEYNIVTGTAVIKNARILTTDFNLVAAQLMRINEKEYVAYDSEFTTCKDCTESWSIFGKVIRLRVNKEVQIRHGIAKVKGVNSLYLPYIAFPLSKRATGVLFPNFSTRVREGLAFAVPVFVAIDPSKDITVTPTFWAQRGYGGDFQYRQRFKELSWFEFNSRTLNDTIYLPGKNGLSKSGDNFFRYFVESEVHEQTTPNFGSHFRYTGTRDLDIVRDHPQFTDLRMMSSDFGLNGNMNWRQNLFSVGAEVDYLRNQLYADPMVWDRSYVQTMPRLNFNSVPYTLAQSRTPGLQHIAVGVDGSLTRFRQIDARDTDQFIRNADRLSVQPYMMWNIFSWGPVNLKTRYTFDQQAYQFMKDQPGFGKNAALTQTEISFTMDRVFGLAYEEKIPIKEINEEDLKKLREERSPGLPPFQKPEKDTRLVGDLPKFESELAQETITQVKNSYRHSQDFKFIHHWIASQNQYGNKTFERQISTPLVPGATTPQMGWFDYEDAIRSKEYLAGASVTRSIIPPQNTVEFQWNNTLIRKSPKPFNYLDDDKYLRDNFNYSRLGYFNVSQGYLLNVPDAQDWREKLTRLLMSTGYSADRWSASISETYFHLESRSIVNVSATRRFDYLNIFTNYNANTFKESQRNMISIGGQVRPTDILGFALVKDIDLLAHKDIRTVYSVDIMPHNNCWILNLNKRETIVGSRYSFNIIWNFGDDKFDRYRTDYFSVKRL